MLIKLKVDYAGRIIHGVKWAYSFKLCYMKTK